MMNENIHGTVGKHLNDVTGQLAAFLERILPSLSDDWWKLTVVDKLSYQQGQRVTQQDIVSLSGLDLAALLRVLDQNWYEISNSCNLTPEQRNFAKEMHSVRNRWAHTNAEGFSDDDIYRDLDTLQRFAAVIEAEESIIEDIRQSKAALLKSKTPAASTTIESTYDHTESNDSVKFEITQIVFVRSDPSSRGPVLSIVPGKPENRYNVFIDGRSRTFYESQLQLFESDTTHSEPVPADEFHAYLSALQIRYPGLSTLYSLNAARVDFIPYQFRPVLRFIRSDRPRMLIADGVGVGKTIEAGFILRELQARREIRSVLIVCPRPLVTERKWQIEMKRFEERFTHLDGPELRFCVNEMDLDGVWPDEHQKTIIPYSLFDESLLYGTLNSSKRKKAHEGTARTRSTTTIRCSDRRRSAPYSEPRHLQP